MFKRLEDKENILRIHSFDGQTIWLDKNTLIYEVGNFLGGGAAGTVYECENVKTRENYALKILNPIGYKLISPALLRRCAVIIKGKIAPENIEKNKEGLALDHVWWLLNESTKQYIAAYYSQRNNSLQEISLLQCFQIWGSNPEGVSEDENGDKDSYKEVYVAATGRQILLPFVPPKYADFIRRRRHIFNEIRNMRKISNHANVIRLENVLELIQESKCTIFLVMELANGGELFDRIKIDCGTRERTAKVFFNQLLLGVRHCHNQGVCHRDLKPENLLLQDTPDHTTILKIADFGFSARFASGNSTSDKASLSNQLHMAAAEAGLTLDHNMDTEDDIKNSNHNNNGLLSPRTQQQLYQQRSAGAAALRMLKSVVGSPFYVAPEILTSTKGYDGQRADVWSLGVILYAMLAGNLPFEQELSTCKRYKLFCKWVKDNSEKNDRFWIEPVIDYPDWLFPPKFSSHAKSLITAMLQPEPDRRITVPEAMLHPLLTTTPFATAVNASQIVTHDPMRTATPILSTLSTGRTESCVVGSSQSSDKGIVNISNLPHGFANTDDETRMHQQLQQQHFQQQQIQQPQQVSARPSMSDLLLDTSSNEPRSCTEDDDDTDYMHIDGDEDFLEDSECDQFQLDHGHEDTIHMRDGIDISATEQMLRQKQKQQQTMLIPTHQQNNSSDQNKGSGQGRDYNRMMDFTAQHRHVSNTHQQTSDYKNVNCSRNNFTRVNHSPLRNQSELSDSYSSPSQEHNLLFKNVCEVSSNNSSTHSNAIPIQHLQTTTTNLVATDVSHSLSRSYGGNSASNNSYMFSPPPAPGTLIFNSPDFDDLIVSDSFILDDQQQQQQQRSPYKKDEKVPVIASLSNKMNNNTANMTISHSLNDSVTKHLFRDSSDCSLTAKGAVTAVVGAAIVDNVSSTGQTSALTINLSQIGTSSSSILSTPSPQNPPSFNDLVKRSTRFITAVPAYDVLEKVESVLQQYLLNKSDTPIGKIGKIEVNRKIYRLEVWGVDTIGPPLCALQLYQLPPSTANALVMSSAAASPSPSMVGPTYINPLTLSRTPTSSNCFPYNQGGHRERDHITMSSGSDGKGDQYTTHLNDVDSVLSSPARASYGGSGYGMMVPSSFGHTSLLQQSCDLFLAEFIRGQIEIFAFKRFYQWVRQRLSELVKKDYKFQLFEQAGSPM